MDSRVKHRFHPLVLILAISLMLACEVPGLAPAVLPTTVPLNTIIAQTAAAASIQTARAATQAAAPASGTAAVGVSSSAPTTPPSPTEYLTATTSATPSNTPTFLFILATHTATPTPLNADYSCRITEHTPDDNAAMSTNQAFQASWTVANNGINTWDPTNIDFIQLAGDKLTSSKAADLPRFVGTGQSVVLTLSMTSPHSAGTYRDIWGLRAGKNVFCRLVVSIVVK